MKSAFTILCVAGISVIVMAGVFVLNRNQHASHESSLREAMLWGVGFIAYSAIDYLLIVPSSSYLISAA